MSAIVYDHEIEVTISTDVRLNGKEGSIEVFTNSANQEDDEALAHFESASGIFRFIDELEEMLTYAGITRESAALS